MLSGPIQGIGIRNERKTLDASRCKYKVRKNVRCFWNPIIVFVSIIFYNILYDIVK